MCVRVRALTYVCVCGRLCLSEKEKEENGSVGVGWGGVGWGSWH